MNYPLIFCALPYTAFRPDAASAEAIRGFIEERRLGRVNPLYLSVSDRYFAESDQVRLTEKRATLNTSEQLLWGLLAIMLDNGGKVRVGLGSIQF